MASGGDNEESPENGGRFKDTWWSRLPRHIQVLTQIVIALTALATAVIAAVHVVGPQPHQDTVAVPKGASSAPTSAATGPGQNPAPSVDGEAVAEAKQAEEGKQAEAARKAEEAREAAQLDLLHTNFNELRGTWTSERNESHVAFDEQYLGRCEVQKHFESRLSFDSLDDGNRQLTGTYRIANSSAAEYTPPNEPVDYTEPKQNCANAATENMYQDETTFEENGPITVGFDDSYAEDLTVSWNPTGCKLNSENCPDRDKLERSLGKVKLSPDAPSQLRLGKKVYTKE